VRVGFDAAIVGAGLRTDENAAIPAVVAIAAAIMSAVSSPLVNACSDPLVGSF
jgi:hypothetical protein